MRSVLSRHIVGTAGEVVFALVGLSILTIYAYLAGPLSFDGGLNFSVAQNILESGRYVRIYSGAHPFPIESDSIFIFLAAITTYVFGAGIVSSQIPNLIFAICALSLFCWVFSGITGFLLALAAGILLSATPGFAEYAFNGYGEIPMLACILTSLVVLIQGGKFGKVSWFFLSGIFFGLAITVKVVALIALPSIVAAPFFFGVRLRQSFLRNAAFAGGVVFAYGLWECYQIYSMGYDSWKLWWTTRAQAIGVRAGVVEGLADTDSIVEKLGKHLDILSGFYDAPTSIYTAILLLFVASVIFATVMAVLRATAGHSPRSLQSFLLLLFGWISICYIGWWLFLTPTSQAWLRRIEPGLLLMHASIIGAALAFVSRKSIQSKPRPIWFFACSVIPVFVAVAVCSSRFVAHRHLVVEGNRASRDLTRALIGLPSDAQIYGIGWYSAPQYSYYSGRKFRDIVMDPVGSIRLGHAYLVMDGAALGIYGSPLHNLASRPAILDQYTYEPLVDDWPHGQILKIIGVRQTVMPGVEEHLPQAWNADNISSLIANKWIRGLSQSSHGISAISNVDGWIAAPNPRSVRLIGMTYPQSVYQNQLSGVYTKHDALVRIGIEGCADVEKTIILGQPFKVESQLTCQDVGREMRRVRITSNFVRKFSPNHYGPDESTQYAYILKRFAISSEK